MHLRGSFKLGDDNDAFQLPPGYRTTQAAVFPVVVSTSRQAELVIYDDGNVQIVTRGGTTGNEVYSLDGVTFRADA